MRNTNIQPRVSTESGKVMATKERLLLRNYPEVLRGYFDSYSADTVVLSPSDYGQGGAYLRFFWEIANESWFIKIADAWTLNLGTTGIDTTNRVAGLIDAIAQEAGRNYLPWAFLDANGVWAGIGLTRKPFSSFSAISGGSAAKGATGKIFTVPSGMGYQFTIGARAVVRNEVALTGADLNQSQFEYNHGTITAVSDTSVTMDMDNVGTYGFNLSGTTNGVIEQWNKFRPYVVTISSQTLYAPYYMLIGEIQTNSTNILHAYLASEPKRGLQRRTILTNSGAGSNVTAQQSALAAFIPLWSDFANFQLSINAGTAGQSLQIVIGAGIQGQIRANGINQNNWNTGDIDLEPNAGFHFNKANNTEATVHAVSYIVCGGMRG